MLAVPVKKLAVIRLLFDNSQPPIKYLEYNLKFTLMALNNSQRKNCAH